MLVRKCCLTIRPSSQTQPVQAVGCERRHRSWHVGTPYSSAPRRPGAATAACAVRRAASLEVLPPSTSMAAAAAAAAALAPAGGRFYGCYLLVSLDPQARVRTYIGCAAGRAFETWRGQRAGCHALAPMAAAPVHEQGRSPDQHRPRSPSTHASPPPKGSRSTRGGGCGSTTARSRRARGAPSGAPSAWAAAAEAGEQRARSWPRRRRAAALATPPAPPPSQPLASAAS
jgi:hypothetical protein